jgi:hypothetical protein
MAVFRVVYRHTFVRERGVLVEAANEDAVWLDYHAMEVAALTDWETVTDEIDVQQVEEN